MDENFKKYVEMLAKGETNDSEEKVSLLELDHPEFARLKENNEEQTKSIKSTQPAQSAQSAQEIQGNEGGEEPGIISGIRGMEKPAPKYTRKDAKKISEEECAELQYEFLKCRREPPSLQDRLTFCAGFKKQYYDCMKKIMKEYGHSL
ncbi:hypothetical protein BB560_005122 [Smittium megazygosporum]|uniref:CHCH domain-containing protein n=1 Tax=Smittium megazygosporum TaxID=133381 RepID=A0A2T9Z7B7_9FUNG|nr:hypothetical protein BB560_005122 [Smittium megazygosporum]